MRLPNSKVFNRKSNTDPTAVVRLYQLALLLAHSITFIIWSVVEPAVALTCACLPTLRPLFRGVLSLASSQSKRRSYRSHLQSQRWRSNHEEDRQPIRTNSPVRPRKADTSTHTHAQDEVYQSYPMDDMQPLRPTMLPERNSNFMLNAVEHV